MIQKSDQRLSKDGVVNGRDRREEEITKELEETMGEAISEASQVYIYLCHRYISPGQEDPLEEELATQSTLVRRTPWTEKSGEVQSIGLQTVKSD